MIHVESKAVPRRLVLRRVLEQIGFWSLIVVGVVVAAAITWSIGAIVGFVAIYSVFWILDGWRALDWSWRAAVLAALLLMLALVLAAGLRRLWRSSERAMALERRSPVRAPRPIHFGNWPNDGAAS